MEVTWDHPDAVALRAAMDAEPSERYADRRDDPAIPGALRVAEDSVTYTGLAIDETGTAIGHCALRWSGTDLELNGCTWRHRPEAPAWARRS